MKIMGVVAMAVAVVTSLWAGQSAAAPEATVTVCIESDPHIPAGTLPLASRMFASIGVRIDWQWRSCPVGVGAIAVTLSYGRPDNHALDALAFARPNERTIVVFPNRVQELNPDREPCVLLAHVLVHEITHILEGICRHSATGVMRARWGENDYFAMYRNPLLFAQEDIDLIYDGLKLRQARLARAATAAVVPVAVAAQ